MSEYVVMVSVLYASFESHFSGLFGSQSFRTYLLPDFAGAGDESACEVVMSTLPFLPKRVLAANI